MNYIKLVKNLKNEEIIDFINSRLSMIKNKEEKEIGLNTENVFYDGLLDEKIKVNVTCEYIPVKDYIETIYGSVIFDDKEIYKYLINEVINKDNIYIAVNIATRKYLGLDSLERKYNHLDKTRNNIYHEYSATMNKSISIEMFHKNKSAMCVEVAGVIQNMYKFLGIESDYIIVGESNNKYHAFNFVYPHGRDNEVLLYDISNITEKKPLVCFLNNTKREDIFLNKKITITSEEINNAYNIIFGEEIKWKNESEDYYIFENGYPDTIIKYTSPFTIERKLKFKNEEKN